MNEYSKRSIVLSVMGSFIITTLVVLLFYLCIINPDTKSTAADEYNYSSQIYHDNIELMYEGARAELVENIDLVIRECAPSTCINGLAILRGCEKYDIDLFFVLAQGQLESHFGTKGMAAKTNSVFNVFAYDGHNYDKINKNGKYSHPDHSIEPYLQLLANDYMSNGKTEQDLMVEFTNVNGNRYASSESYETSLVNIYNTYINNETLMKAYQEYNKYKILSGN